MPYLFVYSADDFVGGLPNESGAMAAGTPTFTLTLKAGATPTLIEVLDNDAVFDEVDGDQMLASAVTIDGTPYAANTTINSAYDLINTGSGHKVTSLHFGGDGYQQGAVDGLVSTVDMVPGTAYTFNSERTSHQKNNAYQDFFACFAAGTAITTPDGARPVETLAPGDMVTTSEGPAEVRLCPSRYLTRAELLALPRLWPMRIRAGALGRGLPLRDLWVSPQHRMLVRSPIARRMFDGAEVLVAATRLGALPGVCTDRSVAGITYHHLILDRHAVIYAEGAPTESFLCAQGSMRALGPKARAELHLLFPDFVPHTAEPARLVPAGGRQKQLMARHLRTAKPPLMTL
ncbi:MAG: Hint domain-containing protein [Pseudomonadota bacterium]